MKLFKNGVGRPSNETIKKRRILIIVLAVVLVGLLSGITVMLNSFSTNKVVGSTYLSRGSCPQIILGAKTENSQNFSWTKGKKAKYYNLYANKILIKKKQTLSNKTWEKIRELSVGQSYSIEVVFDDYYKTGDERDRVHCTDSVVFSRKYVLTSSNYKKNVHVELGKLNENSFNFSWSPKDEGKYYELYKVKGYKDDIIGKTSFTLGDKVIGKKSLKGKSWVQVPKGLKKNENYILKVKIGNSAIYSIIGQNSFREPEIKVGTITNSSVNFSWGRNPINIFIVEINKVKRGTNGKVKEKQRISSELIHFNETWKKFDGLEKNTEYEFSFIIMKKITGVTKKKTFLVKTK